MNKTAILESLAGGHTASKLDGHSLKGASQRLQIPSQHRPYINTSHICATPGPQYIIYIILTYYIHTHSIGFHTELYTCHTQCVTHIS